MNELKITNTRLGKSIHNMDKHNRELYGGNAYDYALGMKKALSLYQNGEYEAVEKILAIINIGIDILNTNIVLHGSQRIDSMTKNTVSNIPVNREYLQANYQVSNTFNGVSLNSINDNLPHRLSQDTLNKLVVETFPDVKSRQCTNDIKYNMELVK